MEMNSSQVFDILRKEYPIFQYPSQIVLGLIIIAFLLIIITEIGRTWAKDIAGFLKDNIFKKIFKRSGKETARPAESPVPTPPLKTTAPCILSASLPPRNSNFTGREEILQSLRAALTC
jgi:hypothetical protein